MDEIHLKAWRKAERERLIAQRLKMTAETRAGHSKAIAERLQAAVGDPSDLCVSVYWPFRGEPDLRDWLGAAASRGGRTALPVVTAKNMPLVFRLWQKGDALEAGVWNIPIPAHGVEVVPDVVIAPLVGFDRAGYRLGYGGGYYDRTLAALPKATRFIGVGYSEAELPTAHPQSYDFRTNVIVTENEVIAF